MVNPNTQFPQAPTSPVVDDKGKITVPWHAFLSSLWNRTGGATGGASLQLDTLGAVAPGQTLYRGPSVWQYLNIGANGQVYTVSPLARPQWESVSSWLDRVVGSSVGSLLFRSGGSWTVLLPGSTGQVLEMFGGLPTWRSLTNTGVLAVVVPSVAFGTGNTDFAINVPLAGFSRYQALAVIISGASASLNPATCGVFSATGGGGTAVVTSGTAVTVTATAENTNNNMQTLSIVNGTTQSYNFGTLQFRVQTASAAPATATVTFEYLPVS